MAFLLDRMLIGTIRFALDKVVSAAAAEMDNEDGLRERLLEAQMRLELGEITEDEFAQVEADVVAGLRAIKERREADAGGTPGGSVIPDGMSVVGASAEISGDMHESGGEGSGDEPPMFAIEIPDEVDAAPAMAAADEIRKPAKKPRVAKKTSTSRKPKRSAPAKSGSIRIKKR